MSVRHLCSIGSFGVMSHSDGVKGTIESPPQFALMNVQMKRIEASIVMFCFFPSSLYLVLLSKFCKCLFFRLFFLRFAFD